MEKGNTMRQMYLSSVNRIASCLLSGTLAIFALSYPALSTADAYLASIEAEADKTTVLQKAQKEQDKLKRLAPAAPAQKTQTKTVKAAPAPAAKKVAAKDVTDKAIKQFETGLYKEFPGNYIVYISLSDSDKKDVVAAYQSTGYVKGLIRYGPSLTLILKLASQ